ncbi:MAG: hypothetical protein AB1489_39300 [Acidobacteriota bacterium]
MKIKLALSSTLLSASLLVSACSSNPAPKPVSAPTPAPTPAAAQPTANANPTGTTKSAHSSPKPDAAKKGVPTDKKVAVPENWVTFYDENKGYEFEVPEGSQTSDETIGDIDLFTAETPSPSNVEVLVLAFKDKTLTKEDLMNGTVNFLTKINLKDVKVSGIQELNDDYNLADCTFTDQSGKKHKARLLVATDVTDNYIMIVSTEEDKFKSNEQIIDAIWGSFSMYSGGASGDS